MFGNYLSTKEVVFIVGGIIIFLEIVQIILISRRESAKIENVFSPTSASAVSGDEVEVGEK